MKITAYVKLVLAAAIAVCLFVAAGAQDCTPPTASITAATPVCQGGAVSLTLAQASGQAPYDLVVNGVTYTNVTAGQTFATVPASAAEKSIWSATDVPEQSNVTDNTPNGIELGMKFRASVAGFITGVRFYKGSDNAGGNNSHVGKLYTASGELLAAATFTNETASGWQEVHFDHRVSITAGTTYVASYYSPSGYFALTIDGFMSAVTNGPLTALATGTEGPNGVYTYSGGFPVNGSDINANYWVDVLFAEPKATASYTLTRITDAAGCTNTGTALSVANVTFSPLPAGTLSTAGTVCEDQPVSLTFTASAGTAPFTLDINNQTYTGIAGNGSFNTGITAAAQPPVHIWGNSNTGGAATDDTDAVTVGVKFRTAVAGKVTGIRFYKQATNTGTHTGTLWLLNPDNTGTALATATFTNETATGWQEVLFATPVSVAANAIYVATYFAPNGQYAFTPGFFANHSESNGPLTLLASGTNGANGVFAYAPTTAFPVYSFNNSNYWVDVIFSTGDAIPFELTRITDANGCEVASDNLQWLTVTPAQCTVTPVTLVSFNARVAGSDVLLDWTTQTEAQNRGFDVQRSVDGKSWTVLGFVAGSGTSTQLHQYAFTDKNVAPGAYRYRLRQVDMDDQATYSRIVAVSIGNPDVYRLEQNYPNPVSGETTIQFTHPQTEPVSLRLFDASGRLVRVLLQGLREKGTHTIRLDGKRLNPGVYYYSLEAGNFKTVKKLTVQ